MSAIVKKKKPIHLLFYFFFPIALSKTHTHTHYRAHTDDIYKLGSTQERKTK